MSNRLVAHSWILFSDVCQCCFPWGYLFTGFGLETASKYGRQIVWADLLWCSRCKKSASITLFFSLSHIVFVRRFVSALRIKMLALTVLEFNVPSWCSVCFSSSTMPVISFWNASKREKWFLYISAVLNILRWETSTVLFLTLATILMRYVVIHVFFGLMKYYTAFRQQANIRRPQKELDTETSSRTWHMHIMLNFWALIQDKTLHGYEDEQLFMELLSVRKNCSKYWYKGVHSYW